MHDRLDTFIYICLPFRASPASLSRPNSRKRVRTAAAITWHAAAPERRKLEIVQLWRCASCKRVFTPGPAALHNKTYPLRMILTALTDYDTGYTLEQTATRLEKRTHRNVSPSTIARGWTNIGGTALIADYGVGDWHASRQSDHPLNQALPSPDYTAMPFTGRS